MHFYVVLINCDPSVCSMDHPKFIASNQKEDSIRILKGELKLRYSYNSCSSLSFCVSQIVHGSRGGIGGPDHPGKSQVIWVSIEISI